VKNSWEHARLKKQCVKTETDENTRTGQEKARMNAELGEAGEVHGSSQASKSVREFHSWNIAQLPAWEYDILQASKPIFYYAQLERA
jgi:hypothetical protein